MNRSLIIGASSDLAINYLNKKSKNSNKFVLLVRDKEKLKLKLFKNTFEDIISLDLSNEHDVVSFFKNYTNKFNNIIFYNFIDIIKPFQFYNIDDIKDSFNVNIISTIIILSSLLKSKSISKYSSIVIINSISGNVIGAKGHSLYSSTKSAISGLVRSLAVELASKKIRINSIMPGLIETQNLFSKNKNLLSSEEFEFYKKKYPLGIGIPENLSDLIDFLLDDKSKWITGQNIILDGGFTLN